MHIFVVTFSFCALQAQYLLLVHVDAWHGDGIGRHDDGAQVAEVALGRQALATKAVRRDAAPLALHARQALARPARLLAHDALGVGGQVALAPLMMMHNGAQVTIRHVRGRLAAVVHRKRLTVHMRKVLAN